MKHEENEFSAVPIRSRIFSSIPTKDVKVL